MACPLVLVRYTYLGHNLIRIWRAFSQDNFVLIEFFQDIFQIADDGSITSQPVMMVRGRVQSFPKVDEMCRLCTTHRKCTKCLVI